MLLIYKGFGGSVARGGVFMEGCWQALMLTHLLRWSALCLSSDMCLQLTNIFVHHKPKSKIVGIEMLYSLVYQEYLSKVEEYVYDDMLHLYGAYLRTSCQNLAISVDPTISDRPSVNGDTLSRHMAAIVVATSNVCLFTLQKNLLHLL